MTGLVNVLLDAMTPHERAALQQLVGGAPVSRQECQMLEHLRLIEVEPASGRTRLSGIGLEVSSRM